MSRSFKPAWLSRLRARITGQFKPTWPTRLGVLFLVLILVIGGLAIVFSNNLLYLVVAMMLGFVAVSGMIAEYTLTGLTARLSTAAEVFARRPTSLVLELINAKAGFPSFALVVRHGADGAWGADRLRLMHLAPDSAATVTWAFDWPKRGWQQIDGIWIATRFPFCLWEKATFLPCAIRVLVFPCPASPPAVPMDAASSMGTQEQSVRGPGLSVVSLRDYVPGDSLRLVHWKRSARTGIMQTKEMEQETERAVTVVLDGALGAAFEHGLSVATALLLDLDVQSVPWALATHERVTRPGTGKAHLREALAHLALLAPPAAGWAPRAGELDRFGTRVIVVHAEGAPPGWIDARTDTLVPVGEAA
jgi:uncharacterized protein (DUF58 family)